MAAGVPGWGQALTLHQAIQQALSGPEARAIAAQTDEANGLLRQAGLGLNPRLFVQSEDWRPWDDNYDFATQTEDYGFVAQTFETDGKRHKRVELAGARLSEARAREAMARVQIAARVAGAYWNAAVMDQTVGLLEQDMQAVDETVRYDKERVDAGAMPGVDLLRMQIERDRLSMALQSAKRNAVQARLELFREMGRPALGTVGDKPTLSDALEVVIPVQSVPIDTVLAQRPDVLAAREALSAAEADVRLQRANGVPDLDLVGGYKRNDAANTGYGSLQMDLPFRNRNQGEVERAKAGVRYAQSSLEAVQLQVRAEVAEAEESYRQEQEMVQQTLPDMRAKAKQNLTLMTAAYHMGGVDLLRYLDAERTEFDVEVNALRTYAEFQQAAVRLQLSYGVQP